MEKKKKLSISIALVVILALFGSVLAYLFASSGANNEIKVTNANASIDEEFDGSNLKQGYNVYKKTVPVKNSGENPCFVRVYMDFSDSSVINSADAQTYFSNEENKPAASPVSNAWKIASGKEWLKGNWVYVDDNGNVVYVDDKGNVVNGSGSVNLGLSGYYYYTVPVQPGESTEPLIRWVMTYFEGTVKVYDILVYTETVQTVGIDGTDYSTNWADAWKAYLHIN